jgi:hypothetical protein
MSRRSTSFVLAAAVVALCAVGAAAATPQKARVTRVIAALDAFQEIPKPRVRTGSGEFAATIRRNRLSWQIRFRTLTGRALAAHIHLARRGQNAGPAIALCRPCRSGQRGSVRISSAGLRKIRSGGAYVNIHTRRYPRGEIRGQLKPRTR